MLCGNHINVVRPESKEREEHMSLRSIKTIGCVCALTVVIASACSKREQPSNDSSDTESPKPSVSTRREVADCLHLTEGILEYRWGSNDKERLKQTSAPGSMTITMYDRKLDCYGHSASIVTWLDVPLHGMYFFFDKQEGLQLVIVTLQEGNLSKLVDVLRAKYGDPKSEIPYLKYTFQETGNQYATEVRWEVSGIHMEVGEGLRAVQIQRVRSTKPEE